jgi:GT2 family glycosyltransferase
MKKVGVLYDNISGNTGDVAIGLSVKKILRRIGVNFEELVPGRFNPLNYETIVIGGGHLIRPSPDFFYDKFRVPGKHILNCCGILDMPADLHYLEDYRYVTVRSTGDLRKLPAFLQEKAGVVPCTSMLLEDLPKVRISIRAPSLGVQLLPNFLNGKEDVFAEWASSLGLNVYFLPITHYNRDFIYLDRLAAKIPASSLLPILKAEEIFTIIGKFDYFISCSLHGAMFAYVHKVPFILWDSEKTRFFMEDRRLQQHMFLDFGGLRQGLETIVKNRPDYSIALSQDFKTLESHVENIRKVLPVSHISLSSEARTEEGGEIEQPNSQINFMLSQLSSLSADVRLKEAHVREIEAQLLDRESRLEALQGERSRLNDELNQTRTELSHARGELLAIKDSFGYNTFRFFATRLDRLLPDNTRRGEFRKIAVASLRIARKQGIGTLMREVLEKIRRREFRLIEYAPTLITQGNKIPNWTVIREECGKLEQRPKISVLMPVFNTQVDHLRASVRSVTEQVYPNWELCICDDGSTNPATKKVLEQFLKEYDRIRVTFSERNEGIAKATNKALSVASGDYIVLFDHDDELTRDASFEIAKAVNADPSIDFIYSDEDKIDEAERYLEPFFKPDFSLHLLRSQNYLVHMAAIRRGLVIDANGFDSEFDGAQDYDLFFRILEKTQRVHHIRKILYHWRESPYSGARNALAKPWIYEKGKLAVQRHLARLGYKAAVEMGKGWGLYRVNYPIEGTPRVDILIPTRKISHMKECLTSLIDRTTWKNYRIFAIINGEQDYEVVEIKSKYCEELDPFTDHETGLIGPELPYNWSKMSNRAMFVTTAPYVIFLNDDTRIISRDWIQSMLQYAQLEDTGAVGAMLLFPDNTIQHAGDYITESGTGAHCFSGMNSNSFEVNGLAQCIRETSAVTSACMMVRRAVFEGLGGFDEELRNYDDYDFCLRLREKGYKIIYTPYARAYHLESPTRPQIQDGHTLRRLLEKHSWARSDPFYRHEYTAMYHRQTSANTIV